jgi:glycosyltransferase involved in cell wall biosynthesis
LKSSISVVIPAYNSGQTILRALSSVFKQTLPPSEVIVATVKLILQQNAGAAAARNTGVRASSGELIAFLDSDDFWHRQKLETQCAILNDHRDIGMCSTTCMFFTEKNFQANNKNIDEPISKVLQEKIPFQQVFERPYLGTPSVMIRKSIFEQIGGFNEELETAEDVDLWIRSTYKSGCILVRNALTYVVEQPSSLSSRATKSPYESHLKVIDHFIAKNSLGLWFRINTLRRTKANVYCKWGSSALVNGDVKLAIKKFLQSLLAFPNTRATYLLLKATLKALI